MIQMKVIFFWFSFFLFVKIKNSKLKLEIEASRVLTLSLGIAKGIEKIHQVGISHRDLKTKNVFIFSVD